MMLLHIKRIYDEVEDTDGYRVLVDRLWPRGISKERASLDEWMKDIAPSADLRKWFGHKPERFEEFGKRYIVELDNNPAVGKLKEVCEHHDMVTLLYGARDPKINHAVVLQEYMRSL
jgi:uncharacterized protein YeaO (DUF488 family)